MRVNVNMTSTSPIAKKVLPKFRPTKVRDPNTPENLAITELMNQCVEQMITYKAYNMKCGSLRSTIANAHSVYRKHAIAMLQTRDTYGVSTNVGMLYFKKSASMSTRNEFIDTIMEALGINEDEISCQMKSKYFIRVDANALKLNEAVLNKTEELNNEVALFHAQVESSSNDKKENFIATAVCWIRDHLKEHRAYLKAYNELKHLFNTHSTKGSYPRLYSYKGVTMCWDVLNSMPSRYHRISAYLADTDRQQYDKFELELKRLQSQAGEWRPVIGIDAFDLDEMMGDDE